MTLIITSKFEEKHKTFKYDNVKSFKVDGDKATLFISKGITATVYNVAVIIIRR